MGAAGSKVCDMIRSTTDMLRHLVDSYRAREFSPRGTVEVDLDRVVDSMEAIVEEMDDDADRLEAVMLVRQAKMALRQMGCGF